MANYFRSLFTLLKLGAQHVANCRYHSICGLEADNNSREGLCILHSKDPNKDRQSFNNHLYQRIDNGNFDFSHFVFPEGISFGDKHFNRDISLSNAVFLGSVNFRSALFDKKANFNDAEFHGDAIFQEIQAREYISFMSAKFCQEADFFHAKFHDSSNFNRTSFCGLANFNWCSFGKSTSFRKAEFWYHSYFSNTTFAGAILFENVIFLCKSEYQGTKFLGDAYFNRARFGEEALFVYSDFRGQLRFDNTVVEGDADFRKATMRSEANFCKTIFKKKALFKTITFEKGADFTDTDFRADTSFSGSVFLDYVIFASKDTKARIFQCINIDLSSITIKPPDALIIRNADLRKCRLLSTDMRKCELTGVKWQKRDGRYVVYEDELLCRLSESIDWHQLERLYRELKQNFDERREYHWAGNFNHSEKETCLNNPKTPCKTKTVLYLYKHISQYGEDYLTPLKWLLILWILSASLFYGFDLLGFNCSVSTLDDKPNIANVILFSFQSMTLMKYSDVSPVRFGGYALNTMLNIIGPLLIGLFALALRQRFKR
ncbi:hypothetical protein GF413_03155 [Candidatus Micrarchaeota archaeon]|nr:hypothetical protein [Candidatus Micrarchaeota archaeon]